MTINKKISDKKLKKEVKKRAKGDELLATDKNIKR